MAFTPTTWNPLDKATGAVLSNGNLNVTGNLANGSARSAFGASSGKWYWEYTSSGDRFPIVGVALATATLNSFPGADSSGWGYYGGAALKVTGGSFTAYGVLWSSPSDVIGVALDMDAGTLTFYKNGTSMGVAFSGLSGTMYAMTGGDTESALSNTIANFGATAFAYTPPAGFQAGFGEPLAAYALSGTVRDATGALASRKVAAYREDTNALVGTTTSDATTGVYSIESPVDTAHTLVFYPAPGESLNALVRRGVLPIES